MLLPILTVEVRSEQQVVLARQQAREIARRLGFDRQEQTRIATAVSEIARNAFQYGGGGSVEFTIETGQPPALLVQVRDRGPGLGDVQAVLDGRDTSGTGIGISGSRRLMDQFRIESSPGEGTLVLMGKVLPQASPSPTPNLVRRIAEELAPDTSPDPLEEIRQQNQELLQTLEELRARQAEVERLNRTLAELNQELTETNRGMVALYAELDDKAEELREASDVKSRFLSYISHEFRTPVGAILRLSQLLLDRFDGDLTPEQEKQVSLIRKSADGLTEMVNDLLDLAKIEAGKFTIQPAPFQAAGMLAALRGMFRPLVLPGHVELIFEEPAGVPAMFTDEGKVSQILRNFISNALKFTQEGEVRVRAEAGPDNTVVFSVADTGIGIAPADQERIFEEFAQVQSSLQKKVKGTGLGLPLSRKLAELLGGSVSVQSEPGAGSTFFLSLPAVYPGCEDSVRFGQEPPTPAARGERRAQVLIIDDSEMDRYLIQRLLADTPYELVEAAGGDEGIRKAHTGGIGLILLDLMMPDITGFEVLERLKADPATRNVPVIIVTSKALTDGERRRLAHAAAVVSKLAPPVELTTAVHEALSRTAARPEEPEGAPSDG